SRLNFDFTLDNKSAHHLVLSEIELSVFDRKGQIVLRKFINENGFRAGIQTVPLRDLVPGEPITVFNPFVEFDPEVDLHELRYRFTIRSENGDKDFTIETTVKPTVYETKTVLSLPMKGRILVHDGHDFYSHHRRVDVQHPAAKQFGFKTNPVRYAYDFYTI